MATYSTRGNAPSSAALVLADRRIPAYSSAVTGHFDHPHSRPWKNVDVPLIPHLAKLLGAEEDEIAHTSTLTSNMHNLFTSFYRPDKKRWKIVIEKGAFPSDWVSALGSSGTCLRHTHNLAQAYKANTDSSTASTPILNSTIVC
jgi:kynureninase